MNLGRKNLPPARKLRATVARDDLGVEGVSGEELVGIIRRAFLTFLAAGDITSDSLLLLSRVTGAFLVLIIEYVGSSPSDSAAEEFEDVASEDLVSIPWMGF